MEKCACGADVPVPAAAETDTLPNAAEDAPAAAGTAAEKRRHLAAAARSRVRPAAKAAKPPKKGRKPLFVVGIVILCIAIFAVLAVRFGRPSATRPAPSETAFEVTPEPEPPAEPPTKLPIGITYTLDRPGKVVMVINDRNGRRVRNLIAQADRSAGEHTEFWDGYDNDGVLVPPGEYEYQAAITPDLHCLYEFTIYNPGTPPFWTIDNGDPRLNPGGWAADHAAPLDVATSRGVVFVGSDVAESGHSIMALDENGRKLWGARWINLAGARCVAGDERWGYIGGEGGWIGNTTRIYKVSPQSFALDLLYEFSHEQGLFGHSGGLSAMAARDGILCVAYNAPSLDYTVTQVPAAALDMSATTANGASAEVINATLRTSEPQQPWLNWSLTGAPGQPLRIAWRSPQEIGTILAPQRLLIDALKADAAYPGDLANDDQWEPLQADYTSPAMYVYSMPGGIKTRALRVRVLNDMTPWALNEPQKALSVGDEAVTAFTGMKILLPGFRNVTGSPQITVSAGDLLPGGAWENEQTTDITAEDPAVYTMTFDEPQRLRALVVRDPFFMKAEVELQRRADAGWEAAGVLENKLYWRRAWGAITFDFGHDQTVHALRLKITQPAVAENYDVKKRTGERANVCSLGGVVLLGTKPGYPPVRPDLSTRLDVHDRSTGKILREIPTPAIRGLAFTPQGKLLAVTGTEVVVLSPETGEYTLLITEELIKPAGIACDEQGFICVSDQGDNTVKRFTATGQYVGMIGKPGGLEPGPYDPEHMSRPAGLAFDSQGRLWVAENEHFPKKISVWDIHGDKPVLDNYFVGAAPYGGGMTYIDPRDPSRFFFQGMEFEVDWKTGENHIKNILSRGIQYTRPIHYNGRLYLASEPHRFYGGVMGLALHKNNRAVPVARMGTVKELNPAVLEALGGAKNDHQLYVWSDLNADGAMQAEEVELEPEGKYYHLSAWAMRIGSDLALQWPSICLAPVRITDDGVPVYSFSNTRPTPPALGESPWEGRNYHSIALTRNDRIIEISPVIAVKDRNGEPLWTYPEGNNRCFGVNSNKNSPPYAPDVLCGSLEVIGQGTLPNIGDFFAVNTNRGEVNIFTVDGLFIARLFRDNRLGTGGFNFPEAIRGMEVGNRSLQQEHFGGAMTQVEDGRVYLVVGHNHNSVVRVDGLDEIERFGGKLKLVAPAPVATVEKQSGEQRLAELNINRATMPPSIDATLTDWQKAQFVTVQGTGSHAGRAALMYDDLNLYAAFEVQGRDDLVNAGAKEDWKLLFRSGDSVDIQLGPDGSRAAPVPGDFRLCITRLDGQPTAVLYRYVVPGTPAAEKSVFKSPVAEETVDSIEILDDVNISISRLAGGGYTVETAIPWALLGMDAPAGKRMRGDLGILFANDSGAGIAERVYWSNQQTGLVSDVPGEIKLSPDLWSPMIFK